MLSQGPDVHCIVVGRDSGHIHFQGGGWQPTLQPFLQERKHYSNCASSGVFSARRTPVCEQTPLQCIGLPCWRSSSLSEGHLDAGAIWCRGPGRGSPSSEECAREGLSRGKWVRETSSGWASAAQPAWPASHPPWACTVSVWVGSLGEMHTCVKPEASCVPVRPCRGGPRSGKNTAESGRTRGKQTGLSELPWIDSRSAGSSRDGVAILRGRWAVVRACRLHDWASPGCGQRAVTCVWLQRRWRVSCDMRCDRIPPNRLMYETAAVLSLRTSTCLPNSSGRNCR